jgi:cobalamin biosynthesis protein CobD/CbiB
MIEKVQKNSVNSVKQEHISVGFEVLTVVVMKSAIFWDITMCSLYIQPTAVFANVFMLASCLAYSSTLKMKATCSSETSVDFQQTYTALYPRDRTLQEYTLL